MLLVTPLGCKPVVTWENGFPPNISEFTLVFFHITLETLRNVSDPVFPVQSTIPAHNPQPAQRLHWTSCTEMIFTHCLLSQNNLHSVYTEPPARRWFSLTVCFLKTTCMVDVSQPQHKQTDKTQYRCEALYLVISVLCYFLLLLHHISEGNIVLFTSLHVFDTLVT